MPRNPIVVQTKLTPPRLPRRVLHRPRLTAHLLKALEYRLTLVQAGTGYGKSTALAALADAEPALAWYHLDEEDLDLLVFARYLLHSLQRAVPALSDAPLAVFERIESPPITRGYAFVDRLINELVAAVTGPVLLVFDDVHVLRAAPELLDVLNRLIERAPVPLHVIFSTRYPLALPSLLQWRVKGEVLDIDQEALAFTPQEIAALFEEEYELALPEQEIRTLATETEGWVIVLQLVWQSLRSGAVATVSEALSSFTGPSERLFTYLAQEILAQQPDAIQAFLRMTSVLRRMTPAICDCVREADDSGRLLRHLLDNALFVVDLGGGHARYQHLFRDFLCHQLTQEEARAIHRQAARCCLHHNAPEEAIFHLLAARAFEATVPIIAPLGQALIRTGRLDTLAGWLHALPADILEQNPHLLAYLGDIARLHSRFEEARRWYQQAEQRARTLGDTSAVGQALRGQARIYLDTVNPTQAEHLLQEALRLSDGQEDREARASLLELMAENRLNLGHPQEAAELQAEARELRQEGPGEAELGVRVLLRTGQLDQARQILEARTEAERQEPVLRPRAHRETLLLLSLILSFQGETEAAYRAAVEGKERGEALQSPFVTAVGAMRQGHAWLLRGGDQGYEAACRCYREAIKISDTLAVPRLKVEAYWGLCRAHGFRGNVEAAERAAERGIAIAGPAGDEWIAALIRVSLGGGYVLSKRLTEAVDTLAHARTAFHACGDPYGQAVTRLWQCVLWHELEDSTRLRSGLDDLLHTVAENRYDYLFTRQTLLGPPEPRRGVPLLLHARTEGIRRALAERLLAHLGLSDVTLHPGYQLRIETLGAFRVWRGLEEITAPAWRRENARRLLQLFLTYRDTLLERDQITEMLWPSLDPETALRDFKVALSTLYKVLEPQRGRGAPSAYVERQGTRYGLRPEADLWLDVEAFERHVAEGDAALDHDPAAALAYYRQAMTHYQGEYLQEYPYADWCIEERERLLTILLRMADRLMGLLRERELWNDVITTGQVILAHDDCWEQAYRVMMEPYAHQGNRALVQRTYQRCVERLREELDIDPSPATQETYRDLVG